MIWRRIWYGQIVAGVASVTKPFFRDRHTASGLAWDALAKGREARTGNTAETLY